MVGTSKWALQRSTTDLSKSTAASTSCSVAFPRRFSHNFCTANPFNPSFIFSLGSLTSSRTTLRARHLFWWHLCLCLSCSAPFPRRASPSRLWHTSRPASEKRVPKCTICSHMLENPFYLRRSAFVLWFCGPAFTSSPTLCDSWTPSSCRAETPRIDSEATGKLLTTPFTQTSSRDQEP